ncbi:hypothetical protein IWZ03DRAFT_237500 [Phyllosticta citriasiana]|uniref:Secreted protein n=1 Tax=Phyllosticta citriasiana TaxID=595635 RepID=A0ABR1KF12_9PEZI
MMLQSALLLATRATHHLKTIGNIPAKPCPITIDINNVVGHSAFLWSSVSLLLATQKANGRDLIHSFSNQKQNENTIRRKNCL